MNKLILIVTLMTLVLTTNLTAQVTDLKIECVLLGQTDIWDIGKAREISMNRIERWVRDIESATGIPVNITRIGGANYNKSFITNFIDNLSYESPENTIVIVYGTGHGFNFREDVLKYPLFGAHPNRKTFTQNEFYEFGLSLQKDVHEKILEKGVKFLLTIGELCNELIDLPVPEEYRVMASCNKNYLELFQEVQGDVITASSKRNQLSYTSNLEGGVYLGEFLRAFRTVADDCDNTADWGTVLNLARENTEKRNGQISIYDVGYIDSAVEVEKDSKPRSTQKEPRLRYPKKEKFAGDEVIAPTIIYINN